ncbi:50S ribosomal protein L29 [Candidatus Uhrbacteria bacterium]|jgi:ribosomal protein L29|nr:50S ribosomal protein L29 [Candidatus Uhrbacteria bacterium]MBT7717104.1 50S ribosomal protein L29 [Candidatus Uhrbacteria bacterium]
MEFKELEKKTEKELQKLLSQERATLYDLRTKVAVNQLKDVREIREVRVSIARILTQLQKVTK